MKTNYFLLSVITLLIWGCEGIADPDILDPANNFVAYDGITSSFAVPEGAESPVEITVNISESQTSDTTIQLDIENVNLVEGTDYILSGVTNSSVTIPAGSFSTSFSVTPIDNDVTNVDENGDEIDRRVIFTLTGNSVNFINGLAGDPFREVVIRDDDCPFLAACMEGVYTVNEVFTSGVNEGLTLANEFNQSYAMTITVEPGDASDTRLVMTSSGPNTYLNTSATLNEATGTVTYDSNPITGVAEFDDFTITSSTYDIPTATIIADGTLGGFGPYQFIFTRQ